MRRPHAPQRTIYGCPISRETGRLPRGPGSPDHSGQPQTPVGTGSQSGPALTWHWPRIRSGRPHYWPHQPFGAVRIYPLTWSPLRNRTVDLLLTIYPPAHAVANWGEAGQVIPEGVGPCQGGLRALSSSFAPGSGHAELRPLALSGLAWCMPCSRIAAIWVKRLGRSRTGRSPAAQRRRRRP
jgi:hypothetical protein